ncbi:MAG: thiol:disulfide interchange protein DsbA/DsbL [Campylobacteraceae bacterium]|nr:thiol:disulfide interchange protein DsbA/DsbL [Campylobacteraceae bacterium]
MKLFKSVVKSVAVAALFIGVSANALTEGKEYVKLERVVPNAENTVIKAFSYDCPFCYKFDQAVTVPVMAKLPDMKFVPFHLTSKGVYGVHGSQVLAVAIAEDEKNGIDNLLSEDSAFKKAKFALYIAYHDKGERWGADASNQANVDAFLKTALDAIGMSKADYEAKINDARVGEILATWGMDNSGDAYMIGKVQGVPAFVVDGKYLIKTNAIKGIDAMVDMIQELRKLD